METEMEMETDVQYYIDNAMYAEFEEWTGRQDDYTTLIPYFKLSNVDFFAEYTERGHLYEGSDLKESTILICAIRLENYSFHEDFTPGFTLALIATGKSKPEIRNKDDYNALITLTTFCAFVDLDMLESIMLALIKTGKSDPGTQGAWGQTALMKACFERNIPLSICNILIETGKSNIKAINQYGWTALMFACCAPSIDKATALIESGECEDEACLGSRLSDGHTAYTLARDCKMYDTAWSIATLHAWVRRRVIIVGWWEGCP